MKTKELIIAELLQAGHLKAEDAAILLTPTYQYVYLDKWPVINPFVPYNPFPVILTTGTYNSSDVTLN